jgi:hypothetical protein
VIQHKTFIVKNWRDTQRGGYALVDARDIYENQANFGARRLRACILAQIPPDVVDQAVDMCRNTVLAAEKKLKPEERASRLITSFAEYKVTREQLETWAGMPIEKLTDPKYFELRGMYQALKDGFASVKDYFGGDDAEAPPPSKAATLNQRFNSPSPAPAQAASPAPAPEPDSFAAAPAGPLVTQPAQPSLFFGQKKKPTIEDLQLQIVDLGEKLGLDVPELEKRATAQFKKSPDRLTIDELGQFAATLEALGRGK